MVTVGVEWRIGFTISYCCWAQVLCLLPGFSTRQSKKIALWSNCQAWWSAITPEGALCAGRELDSAAAGWLMDTPVGCHSINLLVIGAVLCTDPGISLSHSCVHLVIWNNKFILSATLSMTCRHIRAYLSECRLGLLNISMQFNTYKE